MKLCIIGNGFDLAHKMNTSFTHFRNHLMNKMDNQKLVSKVDSWIRTGANDYPNNNEMDWNNFEAIVSNVFNRSIQDYNMQLQLEDTVEDFCEEFARYLTMENERSTSEIKSIKDAMSDVDVILTFNYTTKYEMYMANREKKTDVYHIHGRLNTDTHPVIGFYYPNVSRYSSTDYSVMFENKRFHKPALYMKQSDLDMNNEIEEFCTKYANKFTSVVSIGYSFGESDHHIYSILNRVLVKQYETQNIRKQDFESSKIINFDVFTYDSSKTDKLISELSQKLAERHQRFTTVRITGVGIKRDYKDLIEFRKLKY